LAKNKVAFKYCWKISNTFKYS